MGKLEKYVIGEASVINLIVGMILVFIALAIILWVHSYISGLVSVGGDIVIPHEQVFGFSYYGIGVLIFGLWGGLEIGRYIQTQFTKIRKERLKSE